MFRNFDFDVIVRWVPLLAEGMALSLLLSGIAIVCGIMLGAILFVFGASGGTAWSVASIIPSAGISLILPNATDPFLFQCSGSGVGRVRLACDTNQRATPNFDFTGDGTHPWTFTVYLPMGQGQLHYLSTDTGFSIRFMGCNCPG